MKNDSFANTSLILEGGTFRTLFTAGVLDTLIDENIKMPYIIGISAGAICAVSYVSWQKERTMRVFAQFRHDKRYLGLRNFWSEKSIFGLDFAYNIIPNELEIFDWDTYYKYEGVVQFGVTNAQTGKVEYMNALEMDKECLMLRATCAIPVLFPEIKINEIPYYDGGLAEPVPVQQAIDEGYTKHVIVLTRPKGYRKTMDRQTLFVMRLLRKKYPKLVGAMEDRVDHYNRSMELCEKLEAEGKAIVFRPDFALKSFEKDQVQMKVNYEMGLQQAVQRIPEIRDFLQIAATEDLKVE